MPNQYVSYWIFNGMFFYYVLLPSIPRYIYIYTMYIYICNILYTYIYNIIYTYIKIVTNSAFLFWSLRCSNFSCWNHCVRPTTYFFKGLLDLHDAKFPNGSVWTWLAENIGKVWFTKWCPWIPKNWIDTFHVDYIWLFVLLEVCTFLNTSSANDQMIKCKLGFTPKKGRLRTPFL